MRLAVIIPTLDEEPSLPALLAEIQGLVDEIWVSDGGSRDATLEIAAAHGAAIARGTPGRGGQLNRGARQAKDADAFLFLHADTRLPPRGIEQIRDALRRGAVGGGFRVVFEEQRPILSLGSWLMNQRTHLTRCPLGDQAQFASREAFDALGGFREWPILEDLDFARRLKKHGPTVLIDEPVVTSARRFLGQGITRTILTNWLIWGLYFLGVSPQRLARLYRNIR